MDDNTNREWRELGFYYDFDERVSPNQWRFYGSQQGLTNLAKLLADYAINPAKDTLSADAHYGPYSYLKFVTLAQARITHQYIGGSLLELKALSEWLLVALQQVQPGHVLTLDAVYGVANSATARCFVMADDFDPASLDELVISDRQAIVNNHWQSPKERFG